MPANSWAVAVEPYGTSFIAKVSVAHRAEPYALSKDGKPILFASYGAANRAAHEHIIWLLNKPIYAEAYGPNPNSPAALQEQVFGRSKQKGAETPEKVFGTLFRKGKAIKVERLRRRRRAGA